MVKTTGGPLLCVDDLMQDLLSDESMSMVSPLSSSQNTGGDDEKHIIGTLEDAFEKAYRDLELALSSSGHSWTSSTQQLYSALTAANQISTSVSSNFGILAEKIARLRSSVERGDMVVSNLNVAVAQLQMDEDK